MNQLISCPICLRKFKSLMSHIRLAHHLTPHELLEKYPNTKMVSDLVKQKASHSCIESGCGRKHGFTVSEEQKLKISNAVSGERNPFYGKQHSKNTKRKMSRNHADFRGMKNPLVKWLNQDPQNKEIYSRRCRETWQDPKNYETLCQSNRKSIVKAMLNGNHHPYSKCERGWFKSQKFGRKFYYQSSYEKRFLEYCETAAKISSLQTLPFVIPYKDNDGNDHSYYADFLVNGITVVEIKPSTMMDYNHNREKIVAGRKYCRQNGYDYKLLTENELNDLENVL